MRLPVSLMSFAIFLLLSLSLAGAQQRMRMTPEQRAARLKDSLALSDEQVGKVVTIFQDADKRREEAFSSAGDDRDARMAAMRNVTDVTDGKIDSVLTDAQKTKYDDMKKQRMQGGQGYRKKGDGN